MTKILMSFFLAGLMCAWMAEWLRTAATWQHDIYAPVTEYQTERVGQKVMLTTDIEKLQNCEVDPTSPIHVQVMGNGFFMPKVEHALFRPNNSVTGTRTVAKAGEFIPLKGHWFRLRRGELDAHEFRIVVTCFLDGGDVARTSVGPFAIPQDGETWTEEMGHG